MRYVIINHAYDEVLRLLYARHSSLASQPFAAQMAAYYDTLFATSDSYARNLSCLGHEVFEFVLNNGWAQAAWMRDHNLSDDKSEHPRAGIWHELRSYFLRSSAPQERPRSEVEFQNLLAQLRTLRPDVMLNQSAYAFSTPQLDEIKKYVGILVGEHAAMPLSDEIDFSRYDLIISSFGPTLDWLRARGVRVALVRLGFDPRIRSLFPTVKRNIACSFVGSFLPVHTSRFELVETVAKQFPPLVVHGSIGFTIDPASPLATRIHRPLWGREMFELLSRSQMTLNHHGNVPDYANNMRLYEATGMGALLITDHKTNLPEIFTPDVEVVSYTSAEECADKVSFYSREANAPALARIAAAGQERTFRDHTYKQRMAEISRVIAAL